jgi:phthiocerol/phenolphthiocerol synthesis type-I polyketide synthase C
VAEGMAIAVVGAACRLPGSNSVAAFADLLWAGRDAIGEVPDDRWSKPRYFHPVPGTPGKTYTFAAGCLPDVYGFDADFFGISPREAASIDPQQRLLLELAHEAMEDAGLPPDRLGRAGTGVYVGGSSWDFAARSFSDAAALDAYAMQGAALSSMANRISYLFDLRGPSLTVDTACSSSLVALHLACEALRRGEIGCALVGGVNLLLTPQSFVGFARATMLSPHGRCRPFDAAADGYVRSEGGVALILKPLAAALAEGEAVLGVIRASGINQDGRTNGFSLPSREAQAALLRRVYDTAGIDPEALCYFEAHGTGTAAGDPIEAGAIGEALGRRRRQPLPIGSVKSNIGHLEPASGLAGLLKLLLAFRRSSLPPSLNCTTPNPRIPFAELNLEVVTAERALRPGPAGVLAGLNSFGFGGTNAHAVLAAPEPVAAPEPIADPDTGVAAPLLLSAQCEAALRELAAVWRARLDDLPAGALAPLLRGAAHGRARHTHRLAVAGGPAAAIAARLDAFLAGEAAPGVAAGQVQGGGLAFVFSGNGSQWAGMAREAMALSAEFRDGLAVVEASLAPALGWSVTARLAADDLAVALRDTAVAQPLLFAVQVASVLALHRHGVAAGAWVGHSVGEVAAAWAAGALTLAQACHIVVQRSLAQQATHGDGRMAVLGLGAEATAALLAREHLPLAIAAVNARASVTLAGPADALLRLGDLAAAADWPFTPLDLDYAFHSPAMDQVRERLLAALGRIDSQAPAGLLVSSVTGEEVAAGALDAEYWWRNVRAPVQFAAALDRVIAGGARVLLEIGPQPVLQSFLRDGLQRADRQGRALPTLSRQPAGLDPFAAIAGACHAAGADITGAPALAGPRNLRDLPRYPWQRRPFRPQRTVEGVDLASPVREHPLLGFRDQLAPFTWTADLSTATEPWLADHVVDGVPVLPAAAMIDMALAAARAYHPAAPVLELQDLEISRSLPLEPGSDRSCRAVIEAEGGFILASRKRLAEEAPVVHAACRIVAGARAAPILAWDAAAAGEGTRIGADLVYDAAAALRLNYGPAFRRVAEVRHAGVGDSAATLSPPPLDRVALGYLIDPTLLDGSLQALLVVMAEGTLPAECMVVPWRFGRVRLLRPQGAAPVQALLRPRRAGPRSLAADIALLDAAGAVVAELLECWFVAVPRPLSEWAALAERALWTAQVPSQRQRPLPAPPAEDAARLAGVLAALPADDAVAEESVLLAEACLAATAWEGLRGRAGAGGDGVLEARALAPHQAAALHWLVQDGLAAPAEGGWRLTAAHDLPPAAELWRTLFFDLPEAAAECALLAAAGPWLAGAANAGAPELPAALREQALLASPAATRAASALLHGLAAAWGHLPPGTCLRVALAGLPAPALLRRVVGWAAAQGLVLRLTALAGTAEAAAGLAVLRDAAPDLTTLLWQDAGARQGFDVVLGLYPLSGPEGLRAVPAALLGLLAPGGVLLAAEPAAGRVATLLFGPALRAPEEWEAELRQGGAVTAVRRLAAPVWPVALLTAMPPAAPAAPVAGEAADIMVFTAPDDPLAAALAARQASVFAPRAPLAATPRLLPIEALGESLRAAAAVERQTTLVLVPPVAAEADWVEVLAELLAGLAAALGQWGSGARLWLVSRSTPDDSILAAAMAGLRRVVANELPGIACRTLALSPALTPEAAAERVMLDLAAPDDEPEAWWTPGGRLVPRLRHGLPPLPLLDGARRLEVTRPGLIGSLAWVPAPPRPPGPGEVAIAVAAAALNFRDVMWAQGLLPDEALLDGFSGPSLGLECAGTVTAVGEGVGAAGGDGVDGLAPGDRVIAVAPAALATHVTTPANGVMRLPEGIDFAAGATIPVAFMTAVYALGHLARLQPGERVLIHGGAGGVGLAAIQYALHLGAEVFTTAGAGPRRHLLAALGVAGVFDSRSQGFAEDVLAATGGEGVDVVLNSLNGEMMQQSLKLLRPFGRFVEIGKRDLYRNTAVGIRPLRHNAAYFAVDTDELVARRPALGRAVLGEVATLLAAGRLRPLPYRAFGFADAVDAFRLLQSSGHIGKLVLRPEPTPAPPPHAAFAAAAGVHVVTGGLAGFGLAAARWLVRRGARQLALLGRRGAETPGAAAALAAFAAEGVAAHAFACDVADEAQLGRVLAHVRRTLGPIAGVLHAAMVLDDANLAELDAGRFGAVLRPKLAGALALDRLTREDRLQMFVLFSSVTTVIGTPGQAAYVAANAALEALATRRHAAGLPALAVQWGPIGDAGYLTRETRVGEMLGRMLGGAHLAAAQALDALPLLLAAGRPVVGLADVAWGELRGRLPGLAGPFWSDLPAVTRRADGGARLRGQIAELDAAAATALLVEVLVAALSGILKLPQAAIDPDRPVVGFGVDSLMAVELRTAVEAELGVQVPLLALTADTTLRAMAARLRQVIQSDAPAGDAELAAALLRHEGMAAVPASLAEGGA